MVGPDQKSTVPTGGADGEASPAGDSPPNSPPPWRRVLNWLLSGISVVVLFGALVYIGRQFERVENLKQEVADLKTDVRELRK